MKTYISVKKTENTQWIFDGKTGNDRVDRVVEILHGMFPIFEINVTLDRSPGIGFTLTASSHDFNFVKLYGTLRVQYRRLTYKNPAGVDDYDITCYGKRYFHETPVSQGYTSSGEDFLETLNDFILGTSELIVKRAEFYEKLRKWNNKLAKTSRKKSKSFYIPDVI